MEVAEPLLPGTASSAVDWTRPPVPTELISVLILHTGSVQQEQESSPPAKSLPVCMCPEAQEPGLHSQEDGLGVAPQTPAAAWRPPVCGPEVWMLVEPKAPQE